MEGGLGAVFSSSSVLGLLCSVDLGFGRGERAASSGRSSGMELSQLQTRRLPGASPPIPPYAHRITPRHHPRVRTKYDVKGRV